MQRKLMNVSSFCQGSLFRMMKKALTENIDWHLNARRRLLELDTWPVIWAQLLQLDCSCLKVNQFFALAFIW